MGLFFFLKRDFGLQMNKTAEQTEDLRNRPKLKSTCFYFLLFFLNVTWLDPLPCGSNKAPSNWATGSCQSIL